MLYFIFQNPILEQLNFVFNSNTHNMYCMQNSLSLLHEQIKCMEILDIISSHILSSHFCFSFSSETPIMHILVQLMVSPHVYEAMFIFLYSFNFCSSNQVNFIDISSIEFIVSFFLPAQICYGVSLMKYSFQLLYFSNPEFV